MHFQQDIDNADEIIGRHIYYSFNAFKSMYLKNSLSFILALIKMFCIYFLQSEI